MKYHNVCPQCIGERDREDGWRFVFASPSRKVRCEICKRKVRHYFRKPMRGEMTKTWVDAIKYMNYKERIGLYKWRG